MPTQYRIQWANGALSRETYPSMLEATLEAFTQIRYAFSRAVYPEQALACVALAEFEIVPSTN